MGGSRYLSRRGFLKLTAAAAGSLAALTACGQSATPTPTSAPQAPATKAPATPVPAATAAPAKVTELQFWPKGYVPNSTDVWRQAVNKAMEKRPNLKVTMAPAAGYTDAEEQKLIAAMASGAGPDVWTHGGASGTFWGSKGVSAPLQDYLKASPLAGDYPDAMLAPHTWKGNLHAVPWGVRTIIMQWRKDIFKEVGLDPNTSPRDWKELGEMGQKLAVWKGKDIERVGFGISAGFTQWHFCLYMHEAGGQLFTEDFKQTRINEPAGVEALQFMVDLFHKYKVNSTTAVQGGAVAPPLLLNGQMAMDWQWLSTHYTVAQKEKPELLPQIGLAQPPKGPKNQGNMIFVDPFLINSGSKVKDAAWEFIQEMESLENLELLAKEQGFMVPRKSWYEKFPDKVKADPGLGAAQDAMKIAYPITWGPNWTPFRIALVPFLDEALLLKRSPKEALDAAVKKANSEILTG